MKTTVHAVLYVSLFAALTMAPACPSGPVYPDGGGDAGPSPPVLRDAAPTPSDAAPPLRDAAPTPLTDASPPALACLVPSGYCCRSCAVLADHRCVEGTPTARGASCETRCISDLDGPVAMRAQDVSECSTLACIRKSFACKGGK